METIGNAIVDALPAIIAFIVISLMTFIGWMIREGIIIARDVSKLLNDETTENGGDSTKDQLIRIGDALEAHHKWAQDDAELMKKELGIND